jgi:hypothetical protein
MKLTPDEVKRLMREAVQAVEEAEVPEDLRATAFEKSFDALIGAGGADERETRRDTHAPTVVPPSDGPSLEGIAARLGLELALVEEMYYADGDSLSLTVASSKFDPRKAGATQQIALLLAAGRQAGGWDEWTQVGHIRDACRDYGRFDVANFATTVKRMGDVFSFRGRARQLEVRVTRPGFEQAAALARDLSEA